MATSISEPDQLRVPAGAVRQGSEPRPSPRQLAEVVALLFITVALGLVANLAPSISIVPGVLSLILPLVYLVVDGRVRHRSWADLGIPGHGFRSGLRSNVWLFLLTVVVLQVVPVGLGKVFWPDFLAHVTGRLPSLNDLTVLIPLILVLTFREELIYRGLFQERIGWFVGPIASVAGVSVLFALTHVNPGAVAIVFVDVLFVFFDSLVYGTIFARTRNVYVSWAAHAASDLVGLGFLLLVAA